MSRKLAAGFFGTWWLVFGGCGTAVTAAAFPRPGVGLPGVALAFGLTVLAMAYAVGPASGSHFNPAVTVGLAAGGIIAGIVGRPLFREDAGARDAGGAIPMAEGEPA